MTDTESFLRVHAEGEPQPNEPDRPGTGVSEYIVCHDRLYFGVIGRRIPTDRPTWVTNEDNYNSRVSGEKSYLILAWNGEDFSVLEEPDHGELRRAFAKYKGLTCEEAIALRVRLTAEAKAHRAAIEAQYPKCPRCGKPWLILDDEDTDCGHCDETST